LRATATVTEYDRPGAEAVPALDRLTLGWDPECTFVVDPQEVEA
jgi:hypothetical protein